MCAHDAGRRYTDAPHSMTLKPACFALALLLLAGPVAAQDVPSSQRGKGVELNKPSDFESGMRLDAAGDVPMAIQMFRQGAKKGDPRAEFALGTYYYVGNNVKQDYAAALELFLSASSKGNPAADYLLSQMYDEGQGVERDEEQAVEYLFSAAYACVPEAQLTLGDRYKYGDGVKADFLYTLAWRTLAGEGGHEEAREWVREDVDQMREDDKEKLALIVDELRGELTCR